MNQDQRSRRDEILLSVVVPVAPGRQTNLHLVLASLEYQTLAREQWEVIVVNDGDDSSDYLDICRQHTGLRVKYVYQPRHEPGKGTIQPRNRGARNALAPFLVFADSDVLLRGNVLALYAEDFAANPDRIVVGSYDWLHPMRINQLDIKTRFDDILEERLPKIPVAPPQTHSICRDQRTQLFQEQGPEVVYRIESFSEFQANYRILLEQIGIEPPDGELIIDGDVDMNQLYQRFVAKKRKNLYPKYLACFSGNIAWSAELFWQIGGYWDELIAGAHEDGTSGLAAMCAGIGVSFDKRIRGGHQYHPRNVDYIHEVWKREIPMIDQRFHIGQCEDSEGPRDDVLPGLEKLSQGALEAWGVSGWKTKGRSAEDGFRTV